MDNQKYSLDNPTDLRPATPEDIALAGKSVDELKQEAVAGRPVVDLKKALGRYGKVQFSSFTPTKVFECRGLLESGEDPFYLALYFNVAFSDVAKLANNVLKVRCEFDGRPAVSIPESLPDYLKLAEKMNFPAEVQQREGDPETLAQEDRAAEQELAAEIAGDDAKAE